MWYFHFPPVIHKCFYWSLTDARTPQKLGQPIQERFMEAEERPKAYEELGKQIQQYMKFVEAYKMKVQKKVLFALCRFSFYFTWECNFQACVCVLKPFQYSSLTRSKMQLPFYATSQRVFVNLTSFISPQDEQYDHLDEADVTKVDKVASDAMIWMNSAMNQQSKQSLTVDSSVKVKDIRAKTRVRVYTWDHRYTKALSIFIAVQKYLNGHTWTQMVKQQNMTRTAAY